MLAVRRGAREGLYVTPSGEVTEGTTSNLFIVERGAVLTPPADGTVLGGVTRDLVLRLARRAGFVVREERCRRDRGSGAPARSSSPPRRSRFCRSSASTAAACGAATREP